MSAINIYLNQRNFAVVALLVLMSNLIIGGILLPYQQAQAILSLFPIQVTQWIQSVVADAWQMIGDAYNSAANWISAGVAWWQKADTWYMRALKVAWNILRKKMLDMLVDDIIKWIQGGGKPKLVTDWQGFLKKAADDAAGQFVDQYLKMGVLCNQIGPLRLQFALATIPTFDQAAKCTLSTMVSNLNAFLNNFSNGGWKGWISLSEPQNNFYGSYLMTQDELTKRRAEASQAASLQASASAGFLGDRRCAEIYERANPGNIGDFTTAPIKEADIPQGWVCSKWTIITPGKIVAEATAKAVNVDIDWLISAKEFNEYLGAIIDAVINRAIKEGITYATTPSGGSAGQTGAGISTGATSANASINLSPYQDAIQNNDVAPALTQQLGLMSDNYSGYLGQLQKNLTVLTQTSNTQNSIVNTRQQIIDLGCYAPTYNITATVSSEITSVNNEIAGTQSKTNQISTAVGDIQNYQQAAALYINLYEAVQRGTSTITQIEVDIAEEAMSAAKGRAVASMQATTGSSSTDFQMLLQEIQDMSFQIVQKSNDAQMKRGMISDCSYDQPGTYYSTLCSEQRTLTIMQSYLTACQRQQGAGG